MNDDALVGSGILGIRGEDMASGYRDARWRIWMLEELGIDLV